jgi:predicted phosphate transport protein (TIGR00153 family)
MKFNSILSVFAPKEVKFYGLLSELAAIVDQSAAYMQELFSLHDMGQIEEMCRLIKLEETKGDKVVGQIFRALDETFITPFDREDISALTDYLDDVIDTINRGARKVINYTPEALPPELLEMAKIIKRGTSEINNAINELPNVRKNAGLLAKHTQEIKNVEEDADRIYEKGISSLFHSDIRTRELIKIKEILLDTEKAANKINNVGKILKTIMVKYA